MPAEVLNFVCECAHENCAERLELTRDEYEAIRRVPTHFAVKAGHNISGVEEVVEDNERYVVVAKLGVAAQTAIRLDPRSQDGSTKD